MANIGADSCFQIANKTITCCKKVALQYFDPFAAILLKVNLTFQTIPSTIVQRIGI